MIYFEDVCKLILRKFREDDETEFIKMMFKVSLAWRKRFFRSKSEIFLLVDQNSSLSSQYPNKFPIIAAVRKQISPLSNISISFFSVFMWDNISISTDFYSLNAYCITI